jgi:hypothetical protein
MVSNGPILSQCYTFACMPRFFNTTGPCFPEDHYFLPPETRLRHANLNRYIDQKLYWVLHAPRQTGKTTFLMTWMKELNASGKVLACYVSVERCQQIPEVERAMPAIRSAIREYAKDFGLPIPALASDTSEPESLLSQVLKNWSELCAPKPLVVLFDEVDTLEGSALVSFLRQLRGGFASRGVGRFPVSVALVGMRDLRDYIAQSKGGASVNPGSPFNIKQDSATLSNFHREEVDALLRQHTDETGQLFQPDAVEAIWYWTHGQPYLVNKLADECVERLTSRDVARPITAEMVLMAKENLIQARTTHLDSLAERLKTPDVKKVIQTILVGDTDPEMGLGSREVELCLDLGLIVWSSKEGFTIANPLYREVLPRVLNSGYQYGMAPPEFRWQNDDGTLDMNALMREFQRFWRRHADIWEVKADYPEAFPHLLLMAFFQRVLNGGGSITREYAAGRGRMDLFVEFANQGHVIEIKLVHPSDGREVTLDQALAQVTRYRATVGGRETATYVALFDRTEAGRKRSWDERLTWNVVDTQGGPVTVVGL